MEVSSVSSSLSSALASSLQAQARTSQAEQDQPVKSAPSPLQSDQTQSTQQAQSTQSVDESESARPSVNVNGQVVGTRVNTTA